MTDAIAKILMLERGVAWRKRLLSLQDGVAVALTIGGIVAAGLVLVVRLRPVQAPVWVVIVGAFGLSLLAALIPRVLTRVRLADAAFLIDEALGLEDRTATSHLIIERGGPGRALEEALIEDTAERVANHRAAGIVSLRMRSWHFLPLVPLIALAAALMITQRTLPVTQALATERADIESAAEHLERTASEVEQLVPAETETARLATEQAELGRGFQRSSATRADVLKELSALEERIRRRRDDLASTRAEEIVDLADRRLGGSVQISSVERRKIVAGNESQSPLTAEPAPVDVKQEPAKRTGATPRVKQLNGESSQTKNGQPSPAHQATGVSQSKLPQTKPGAHGEAAPRKRPQERPEEPVSGKPLAKPAETDSAKPDLKNAPTASGEDDAAGDQKASRQKPADQKAGAEETAGQDSEKEKSKRVAGSLDALKAVPNTIAEQAAKALPKLSEELLKKAAQLRANELTPTDVEKLRKAAEFLSRDLEQISQSKDLQQALQEMARQVRPDQMEKVARELASQENLKQELESAGRLLRDNRQAKEIAAGLAAQFARVRDEMRQQINERSDEHQNAAKSDSRNGKSSATPPASPSRGRDAEKISSKLVASADRSLAGQGRESSLKGRQRQGSEGVYLYLQSKAGAGAARAPYAAGYPRYRREAERSVQRSQVPPALRSVVRKYFDAINPDGKK